MMKSINLETQIEEARRSIDSDGYPMSIGELTNLYKDGELIIRPEFQRFFRWSSVQKSRLIESIILGIPLPSIFVAQTEKGKWELVDGLQRVSTILELQGELKDKDGRIIPALILEATKFLPDLRGRSWNADKEEDALPEPIRLDIKRSKVDVKIIKRTSSPQTKFDLFQRLNNYGTPLNSQEMRSALMVAASPDFFAWLEQIARYESFIDCVQLSDKLIEERFDLELVTRFLVLHNRSEKLLTLSALRDLPTVLDDESTRMALDYPKDLQSLEATFKTTFDFIAGHGGEDVFRRYDPDKATFKGSFLSTAFEVFGLGVGYQAANNNPIQTDLLGVVKSFWERPEMSSGYATGKSTEARLGRFVPLGREITRG